jgi:D-alanyl-D-alanine carboxypeptidase
MICQKRIDEQLKLAMRAQVSYGCPDVILEISAPDYGYHFSGADGVFCLANPSEPLLANDSFRVASVTKAVTAATALCLAADQIWNLDDPVCQYLPENIVEYLEIMAGQRGARRVTLQHLLGHSSGIPDYFFDTRFQDAVRHQPNRLWQPAELVEAAAAVGGTHFYPGEGFSYGDSAYVLIGIAIENVLGCCLHKAYFSRVFKPLNMHDTYLEWREDAKNMRLSHHYDGALDMRDINLSYDWAGGGLVSTGPDLTKFLHGIFGERLFAEEWVSQLSNWRRHIGWRPGSSARYLRYGLGMGANIAYGEEIIGVTGVWGAFAYYWPAGNTSIVGTLNRVNADRPALMDAVIGALWESLKSQPAEI